MFQKLSGLLLENVGQKSLRNYLREDWLSKTFAGLLRTSQDQWTLQIAVEGLKTTLKENQFKVVVENLKNCLSEDTYKNNLKSYSACLEGIFHCTQNMPYAEFYRAWSGR